MCGIAGWAGSADPAAETAVRRMTGSMERRGPDGEGLERGSAFVLGHRRLSIFDLSDLGRQPMLTPDRRVALVFNGAIYNFRDLKTDLLARGYNFRSQTDTEVLLHGYRAWGIDGLLERIRGMFAIGLWDEDRSTLWLIRDRLGVKPLFWTEHGGRLAFASTARALREAGLAGELDPAAVAEFLQRGYVSDERSIWRGLHKLPAGHVLEWRAGQPPKLREYWRPPEPGSAPRGLTFQDAVAETERLLLDAVRRRLDADVPVGALLSDGIDSGLVCWAIARLGGDIQAFTIAAAGDASDESAGAAATARHLGIRHAIIPVSGQQAPALEDLVAAYGEPFACASALGMLQVSQAVRREATVLLTGDGGDDVFLGYPEHRACWLAQRLAKLLPVEAPIRALAGRLPASGPLRRARTLLLLATRGVAGWQLTQDRHAWYRRHAVLGERLRSQAVPELPAEDSLAGGRRLLEEFLAYDRRMRFPGEYMTKVDGGAMYHALEARSPFLDQELWEFAASLPVDMRLQGGELKAILRALARRHLGDRTAGGAKRGFTIPVSRWMAGPLRERAAAELEDSQLGREGWIDPRAAAAQVRTASGEMPLQLWYLWVLEHWLRHESIATAPATPTRELISR